MAKIKDLVVKVLKEEVKILKSRLEQWDEDVEDGLWKVSGTSGLQAAIDVIQSRIHELESFEKSMYEDYHKKPRGGDEMESGKLKIDEIPFDKTEPG